MNKLKIKVINTFYPIFICTVILSCTDKTLKEVGKEEQNNIAGKESTNEINNKKSSKMRTIHITKEEFLTKVANYEANPGEWKYLGDKPAVIDFYADWCAPCKMIAPLLEELAEEYKDDIYIYKIDTEQEQELASAFGIRSIPTLLFIPMDGKPQVSQGALPKEELKKAIDEVLLKK